MAQATAVKLVEVKSCSTCPYFDNFSEPTGRGWCRMFDHYAREHHAQTQDCILSSEIIEPVNSHELEDNLDAFPEIDPEAFSDEELIDELQESRQEYQVGNVVKIIDYEEDHTEWAVFEIREVRYNELLHDDLESDLQGSRWYYHLVSNQDTKSFGKSIWVAQKEICHFDESHLFCTHSQLTQLPDTSTKASKSKPKPILKSPLLSAREEELYTVIRTWDNGSVYMGSRVESVLIKPKHGNAKPSWETVIQSQGIVKGDILTRGRGGFLVKASRTHAA